jgi:hypothetical protein
MEPAQEAIREIVIGDDVIDRQAAPLVVYAKEPVAEAG